MTERRSRPPAGLYALLVTLAFQGLSGVTGGVALVLDPSGGEIGLPLEWLEGTPFADYLVPGLILLTVLGLGPLLVVYGVWAGRSWALPGSAVVGSALLIWIAVEIAVVGYHPDPPLQLVYGGLGVLILVLALLPSVQAWPR